MQGLLLYKYFIFEAFLIIIEGFIGKNRDGANIECSCARIYNFCIDPFGGIANRRILNAIFLKLRGKKVIAVFFLTTHGRHLDRLQLNVARPTDLGCRHS